jgi:hypothetical protein
MEGAPLFKKDTPPFASEEKKPAAAKKPQAKEERSEKEVL